MLPALSELPGHLPPTLRRPLREAAQRAGLFGALRGGLPGREVAVVVPVVSAADIQTVLEVEAQPLTLLVAPALALSASDELAQARAAGFEVAGRGPLAGLTGLEVAAGQAVSHWEAGDLAPLPALWQAGLAALPLPEPQPQPGSLIRVAPAGLAARLAEVQALGYRPVALRDLPGLRQGRPFDLFQDVYQAAVEDRYARQIGAINLSQRFDGVLKVAPLDHAPAPLPLPRQAPTAELHVNSRRLVALAAGSKLATYRAAQRSLKDVAQALQTRPELAEAQAVFAVTLFYGPLQSAGFSLLELPRWQAQWYGLGFRALRLAYGTTQAPSDGTPRMAWMLRREFLERFGRESG